MISVLDFEGSILAESRMRFGDKNNGRAEVYGRTIRASSNAFQPGRIAYTMFSCWCRLRFFWERWKGRQGKGADPKRIVTVTNALHDNLTLLTETVEFEKTAGVTETAEPQVNERGLSWYGALESSSRLTITYVAGFDSSVELSSLINDVSIEDGLAPPVLLSVSVHVTYIPIIMKDYPDSIVEEVNFSPKRSELVIKIKRTESAFLEKTTAQR